ncbi:hypothetical protein RRF57_008699 [Xylaria bambusicola]|uniref:Uncharacterized protein n=1 Tax=Xylaria bambusicola TaxID=326684 RepID=A0AAN7UIB4_9PEZI
MLRSRCGHLETNNLERNPIAQRFPYGRLLHSRRFPPTGKARGFLGQTAAESGLAAGETPDSPGSADEETVVEKLYELRWGGIEAPDMSDKKSKIVFRGLLEFCPRQCLQSPKLPRQLNLPSACRSPPRVRLNALYDRPRQERAGHRSESAEANQQRCLEIFVSYGHAW